MNSEIYIIKKIKITNPKQQAFVGGANIEHKMRDTNKVYKVLVYLFCQPIRSS